MFVPCDVSYTCTSLLLPYSHKLCWQLQFTHLTIRDTIDYRIVRNIGGNYIYRIAQKWSKIVIGGFNIGGYAHDRSLQ